MQMLRTEIPLTTFSPIRNMINTTLALLFTFTHVNFMLLAPSREMIFVRCFYVLVDLYLISEGNYLNAFTKIDIGI